MIKPSIRKFCIPRCPCWLSLARNGAAPAARWSPFSNSWQMEWKNKPQLAKVDVDESVNLTMQFQVMSVPTLILFINGEACQRVSGKQPRERLVEKFSPYL
jgi:thioredoxin 1